MSALISAEEAEIISAPDVGYTYLMSMQMPDRTLYMHAGVGYVTVDGQEYRGVSSPDDGRIVKVGVVAQPHFGQAAAVEIVLSGADAAFFKEMHEIGRSLEGLPAQVSWVAFCQFRQEAIIPAKLLFPFGTISAPKLKNGPEPGLRTISIRVEGPFSDRLFPAIGRWSPAGQQSRYRGDKGLQFMGQEVLEIMKAEAE